jgi:hypothetical protein
VCFLGADSLMNPRSDVVVCSYCGMDTCEVYEENGELDESCGMCGFYRDPVMERIPSLREASDAIDFVIFFKEWANKRNIEEPSDYAIMRSRKDGISMWMNLEDLPDGKSFAEYNGELGYDKLKEESVKIFNFFFNDEVFNGGLSVTEKMEIGKEGVDLMEYIIG